MPDTKDAKGIFRAAWETSGVLEMDRMTGWTGWSFGQVGGGARSASRQGREEREGVVQARVSAFIRRNVEAPYGVRHRAADASGSHLPLNATLVDIGPTRE
jgi:hypothetical protein